MNTGSGYLWFTDFAGQTLHFGNSPPSPGTPAGPTLNLYASMLNLQSSGGGRGTINAYWHSTLNLDPGGHQFVPNAAITVNIGAWDDLTGTLGSPRLGSVAVNGLSSVYRHQGETPLGLGDTVVLNTNVLGTGAWTLGFLSKLDVAGRFNETVHAESGRLDLEQPALFTGQIELASFGIGGGQPDVVMHGLLATGAAYSGGLLSLDFGSELIEQLKLTTDHPFAVYQTPQGVEIWQSGLVGAPTGPHTLLLHT